MLVWCIALPWVSLCLHESLQPSLCTMILLSLSIPKAVTLPSSSKDFTTAPALWCVSQTLLARWKMLHPLLHCRKCCFPDSSSVEEIAPPCGSMENVASLFGLCFSLQLKGGHHYTSLWISCNALAIQRRVLHACVSPSSPTGPFNCVPCVRSCVFNVNPVKSTLAPLELQSPNLSEENTAPVHKA